MRQQASGLITALWQHSGLPELSEVMSLIDPLTVCLLYVYQSYNQLTVDQLLPSILQPGTDVAQLNLSAVDVAAEEVTKDHQEQRNDDFEDLIRNGSGYCNEPVQDATDSTLLTALCYSPPMQLKPGQVSLVSWLPHRVALAECACT